MGSGEMAAQIAAVENSDSCLNGAYDRTVGYHYDPKHGECSKTGAEGSHYWMHRKLGEQELDLNMKSLKLILLHRRLREQYHLEKKHRERWLNDDNGIPARQCWHCALRFTRSSKTRSRALAPKLSGITRNIGGHICYRSLRVCPSEG